MTEPATRASILVVDDNPANLRLLTDTLSGRGYAVRAAPTAALAIEAVKARRPDLILLDIRLPDMSGFDVCAILKQDPANRDVPIIFISALHETLDKLHGFEVGGIDYITKPFAPEEVLARVRIHVDLRALRLHLEDLVAERTEALSRSEKVFRAIFEQAAVGIARIAPDGRWIMVNQRLCDMVGYSRDELLERWLADIVHPEDTGTALALRGALDGAAGSHTLETRLLHKDGAVVWARMAVSLMRDDDGAPAYFILVIEDVSRRKQAEVELERWGHVFRNAGWGIAVSDAASDTLELVNPCLAQARDYRIAELVNQPMAILFSAAERERLPQLIHQADEKGHLIFEAEHVRKNGETFPVRIDLTSIKDAAGRPLWRAANIQDITQEKEAEGRLRRTIDALVRSNADLERFAFAASHDLKEPLRSIVGLSQLLERTCRDHLDQDGRQLVDFIVDGAKRMVQLVDGLLEFSRVDSQGRRFTPVPLGNAAAAAIDALGQALAESGAQVDLGAMPTVAADEVQITHLFQNLIGNAVKFRRLDRPPVIRIDSRRIDGEWEVSVSDNGIGIDPAYAEQIFVLFKRLHTHDAYPGSGIGLALCKRIVERHGGRIWVESELGQGAAFRFTLPAVDGEGLPQ